MNDLFFSSSDLFRMREVCRKMRAEPRAVLEKLEQIADICEKNDIPLADAGIFVQPSGGVFRGVRPVDGICGFPADQLVRFAEMCQVAGITPQSIRDWQDIMRGKLELEQKAIVEDFIRRVNDEVRSSLDTWKENGNAENQG